MIIKGRKNSRYYYNEPELFIYGPKERLKLKVNNADYQEIVKLIQVVSQGMEASLVQNNFARHDSLIQLFLEKHIFYQIDSQSYAKHKDMAYLPWVEEACLDVQEGLAKIGKIQIQIPTAFFGAGYLSGYLSNHQLKNEIVEVDKFNILLNNQLNGEYYIWKEGSDICISTRKPANTFLIEKNDISERLLASFLYYCVIVSVVGEGSPVFRINDLLEVERKQEFLKIEKANYALVENSQQDPIKNYNAIESFVKKYDSKIKSLNGNPDYLQYNQSPLQVITIQTEKQKNYYLADISFERLSQFVTEAAFAEILQACYGTSFILLANQKVVYNTLHDEKGDLQRIELEELKEGALIHDLFLQENLKVNLYLQESSTGGSYLYILNQVNYSMVKFQIPLRTEDQLNTALLTWISMAINQIEIEESFFCQVSQPAMQSEIYNHMVAELLSNSSNRKVGRQTNLGEILSKEAFGYELLEVGR
ncbi:hypothetical protein CKN67_05895 [Carnobacterium divergens]|uniref:hypothetical protein n=1 Tax=Carnobacterium divergens TaxID=2748 RepID=UPI0010718C2C|nr:hypothetical protein [Carnobacterium divergens]TFI98421.1 hypothetical protein CKN67_05895 [Carnobacterium divergens]